MRPSLRLLIAALSLLAGRDWRGAVRSTALKRYFVAFSGGARVGSSFVCLRGALDAAPTHLDGDLAGSAALSLGDVRFAGAEVNASIRAVQDERGWSLTRLTFDADVQVLGTDAKLMLSYLNGDVTGAAGALQVSGTVGPARFGAGGLVAYAPNGLVLSGDECRLSGDRATTIAPRMVRDGGRQLVLRLCAQMALGSLSSRWHADASLPMQIPIDFDIPRVDVGLGIVSAHLEGGLHGRLTVGLSAPSFWVDAGNARAGGCVGVWRWKSCFEAIGLEFVPAHGQFEGRVLGFEVRWGSDDWRRPTEADKAAQVDVRTRTSVPGEDPAGLAQWGGTGIVPAWTELDEDEQRTWQVVSDPGLSQLIASASEVDRFGSTTATQLVLTGVAFDASRRLAQEGRYATARVVRSRVDASGRLLWRRDSPELDVAALSGGFGTFQVEAGRLRWSIAQLLAARRDDPRAQEYLDAARAGDIPLPVGLAIPFDQTQPPAVRAR